MGSTMFMLGPQDLWRIPPAQIAYSAGILAREISSSPGILSFFYRASTRQPLSVDGGGTSRNQAAGRQLTEKQKEIGFVLQIPAV